MAKWIREPLLHFLLAGGLMFALYAWVNPQGMAGDSRIVVDRAQLDLLEGTFARTWNRQPTPGELRALVDNYIIEEVLYRQARALGLDQNDNVIRRRLRQKMEILAADTVAFQTPGDDELQAFLQAHPERFARTSRYTFEQRYVRLDRPASELKALLENMAQQLASGNEISGDRSMLASRYEQASSANIDRNFGQGFAAQLDALAPGQWSTPLSSGLGLHFVRVLERAPGQLPALASVRDEVLREWRHDQGQQLKADLINNLKDDYEIIVDGQRFDDSRFNSPRFNERALEKLERAPAESSDGQGNS